MTTQLHSTEKPQTFPVHIYMNEQGTFFENPSALSYLDCNVHFVSRDWINPLPSASQAVCNPQTYPAGMRWPDGIAPGGVVIVETVLLATTGGNIRIAASEYDALLNYCNRCCVQPS